jgi:hypothetical protein
MNLSISIAKVISYISIIVCLITVMNITFNPIINAKSQADPYITNMLSQLCPDHTQYDFTLGVCTDAGNAYGIFPQAIITKCGKSLACTILREVTRSGQTISLNRYSKSLYAKLRGSSQCPIGTTIISKTNVKENIFCKENIKTTINGQMTNKNDIIGPINPFMITICQSIVGKDNGNKCLINRLDETLFNEINLRINNIGKALTNTRTFMYHGFEESDKHDNFMNVNVEDFKAQLNWLIDNGYTITTTQTIINSGINNELKSLPSKRAILQLDDGYASIMLANKVAKEISIIRSQIIPLEIGLVQDNVSRSPNHLNLEQYNQLVLDNNSIISHTKGHCSLGDETTLHPITGKSKMMLPPFVDCEFYKAPSEKYLKPLSYSNNIRQHSDVSNYLKTNFNINTPAVIYPFGHNSQQNMNILRLLGINYGYSTAFQKTCNSDLPSMWVDSNSNLNIPRTTVSGLHTGVTDNRSWFKLAETAHCN